MTDIPAAPTMTDYPILVDGYGRQFVKVPVEDFVKMEVVLTRSIPAEALDVERLADALHAVQGGAFLANRHDAERVVAEYARLSSSGPAEPEDA